MTEIKKEAEVVIIGAGVIGCAIAYWLAKKGKKDVFIIERREIAGESSGANMACIKVAYSHPVLSKLSWETMKGVRHFSEEIGRDFGFIGPRLVLVQDKDLERFRGEVDKAAKLGIPGVKIINREELAKLEPYITPTPYACLEEASCIFDSYLYLTALGDQARKLGARICEHTEVLAIKEEKGHVKSVITDKGEMKAEYIVNAAGAWAPQLAAMVGLRIPLSLRTVSTIVTEEVPIRLVRTGGTSETQYASGADDPGTKNVVTFTSFRQMKKGNLVIGRVEVPVLGSAGNHNEHKWTTFEGIQSMARSAVKAMPALKELGVHIIRSWANLYAMTPDYKPILGTVEDHEGLIMANGLNDYGMSHGHKTGELIAELICCGETSIPLDDFRLSRFG